MRWEVLSKGKNKVDGVNGVVDILLKNRNISDKKEFFSPKDPTKIGLSDLGVDKKDIKKVITRVNRAKKSKEKVIVYGDYDADGICAAAIAWEALYSMGIDALPYIPDRFEEGYGLNPETIEKLKSTTPELNLIITVDNGIVAYDAVKKASELGIDVVVIDHHAKGSKKLSTDFLIHSTLTSGSGLGYFFAKELGVDTGLELAAIGTIADQLPLTGVNRSIVSHGLKKLNKTKRPGLLALFTESQLKSVGTYEVNYIIAPRINAMGRLKHGVDSLRLICTKSKSQALELSSLLSQTNRERQEVVEEVLARVGSSIGDLSERRVIVVSGDYHEGVIGLIAGRLTEKFYRPAIVISKGEKVAKASARSISGFNIIEAIRKLEDLIIGGGGHPMAAGFSINESKIEEFTSQIEVIGRELISEEDLTRKLKIDLELPLSMATQELMDNLKLFAPTGNGNPQPTFLTKGLELVEVRGVGQDNKHIKLKVKQDEKIMDAIAFNFGYLLKEIKIGDKLDMVYAVEENEWNGRTTIQLKVRDIKKV